MNVVYTVIEHGLVAIGILALAVSIPTVGGMIRRLPAGSTLTLWKLLLGLICFFIFGYSVVLALLGGMPDSALKKIIVCTLFGGGIFVWIMTRVSVDSADILERLVVLERQSTTDPLMQIYNRRYLELRLEEEFYRSVRYKQHLSVMMLDVDNFKHVNDRYGHVVGDKVLVELAHILRNAVRKSDVVARFGGEEIAIICPDIAAVGARVLAERLRISVRDGLSISLDDMTVGSTTSGETNRHDITVSIGVSCLREGITEPVDMIKRADVALYRAKHEGRDRVVMDCDTST
jgi:diguanylate cyclase (GGDEF)-like protein